MSYIKTTWETGDTVTAEKLNNIENGIESLENDKSTVSVSGTGTATDEVSYITIDGVEKKLAGGGTPSWSDITNKPFSIVDTDKGLYVEAGWALCANVTIVSDTEPSYMHNNDTWLEVIE